MVAYTLPAFCQYFALDNVDVSAPSSSSSFSAFFSAHNHFQGYFHPCLPYPLGLFPGESMSTVVGMFFRHHAFNSFLAESFLKHVLKRSGGIWAIHLVALTTQDFLVESYILASSSFVINLRSLISCHCPATFTSLGVVIFSYNDLGRLV